MLLQLREVSKVFRTGGERGETVALRDLTLDLESGEFCALIGPSGCGKSTLLRMVDGLVAPTQGEVLLRGEPVTHPGRDRGMVFQHAHLLPWRTMLGNVEFGLECLGVARAERRERALRYLAMVGLEGFERHYPGQLSGGMQQRVGLARAYAIEPEILLLDEPFGALDAQTRLVLQADLERLWEQDHRTALLVTHDMEEAVFLADRVAVITARPGSIAATIDVPFDRPRHDELRNDPAFARVRAQVWEALKAASRREPPDDR